MQIKMISPSDDTLADHDYRSYFKIEIDGKEEISVYDGEPEDSNLSRNFSDIYKLPLLLVKAYEAGKNGEPFVLENVEE